MMSMKEAGKPISFVEDCAVPLEHLADYTAQLTAIFEKHGTRGTWYAHASVGCLHVRPVLNLRLDQDVAAMRAIAEEAFALVRAYKGSHSGEHGDGIVRSEFHPAMFGERLAGAFEEVKDRFDPHGLFNPGKIVRAPKFDDRELLRYGPHYHADEMATQLDWSAYPGAGGGFQGAVEMCNNNGACRSTGSGVMCPSYRVTREERDVTRGRANSLRLAITGQLGADAFASDEMAETMKLCVSCKACRRECPTGVDMARMKIEVQAARAARNGLSLHDRLVGYLPRYAPFASRLSMPAQPAQRHGRAGEAVGDVRRICGAAKAAALAQRSVPRSEPARWRRASGRRRGDARGGAVRRHLQPLFRAGEHRGRHAGAGRRRLPGASAASRRRARRPLCCGRTFLSVGLVDEARREAERTVAALAPYVARGIDVVGLEPSCLFGFRDEIPALLRSEPARDARRPCAHLRGIRGARGAAGRVRSAARADRRARAAARPLPSEILRHHGGGRGEPAAGARACGRDGRDRAAAAWRAPSATGPTPSTSRSRWPSCRCCRRCAPPPPTRSWSRPAPHAGIRSPTAAAASRCMWRACWR